MADGHAALQGSVAALALAACGGTPLTSPTAVPVETSEPTALATVLETAEPSPTSEPSPIDPCALISQEEAEQVAGRDLQPPQPAGQPPVRCVWPTQLTGSVAQVELDVGDGAKKQLDIDKTTLGHPFTAIANLGDEAWIETGAIFFRAGDTWVSIHAIAVTPAETTAKNLEALARLVVERV